MENSPKHQEYLNPSLVPSPKSYSSNSSTSSTSSNTNNSHGLRHHQHQLHQQIPPPSTPPPRTPTPITRSDPNHPYPTTFVQADTSSFKQVVQMLTGSSETAKVAASSTRPEPFRNPIPPIRTIPKKEKSASRLYERRNSLKNFKISPLGPGLVQNKLGFVSGSPRPTTPEILSPSILDFPSLVLSPVTPLIPDPFNRCVVHAKSNLVDREAEEKAIAQKGFYLHPSPANTPRDSEPRLLTLFPVTSPRVSAGSDNSNS